MTFGKWNDTGSLTWEDQNVELRATELGSTILAIPPIGTIMPWVKSLSGVPTLPNGWLECDGQFVADSESPLNTQQIPDLNGENRFLCGSNVSDATGGNDTHTHTIGNASGTTTIKSLTVLDNYVSPSHTHTASTETNVPPYFDVVYIIRVK